mmetsp:Transcript_55013/g.75193  ORF Transcript_55013/g.75193 Transcript_55013/m.75193 type:complete len:201 (-) Transcript_55013:600-1202(-)
MVYFHLSEVPDDEAWAGVAVVGGVGHAARGKERRADSPGLGDVAQISPRHAPQGVGGEHRAVAVVESRVGVRVLRQRGAGALHARHLRRAALRRGIRYIGVGRGAGRPLPRCVSVLHGGVLVRQRRQSGVHRRPVRPSARIQRVSLPHPRAEARTHPLHGHGRLPPPAPPRQPLPPDQQHYPIEEGHRRCQSEWPQGGLQ